MALLAKPLHIQGFRVVLMVRIELSRFATFLASLGLDDFPRSDCVGELAVRCSLFRIHRSPLSRPHPSPISIDSGGIDKCSACI